MSAPVYLATPEHSHALQQALGDNSFLVVGLCAAWCNTCTEFRDGFESIAATRPDSTFVWLDIEDDAEIAGDIDVENFPTIAVFHRKRLLHYGASLPQPPIVARLLAALSAESETVAADIAVTELPERLARPTSN